LVIVPVISFNGVFQSRPQGLSGCPNAAEQAKTAAQQPNSVDDSKLRFMKSPPLDNVCGNYRAPAEFHQQVPIFAH